MDDCQHYQWVNTISIVSLDVCFEIAKKVSDFSFSSAFEGITGNFCLSITDISIAVENCNLKTQELAFLRL